MRAVDGHKKTQKVTEKMSTAVLWDISS